MKKLLLTTAFSLSLFSFGLYAQEKKINIGGKIISFEESFPLEGANITVKGTKNVTGTQSDGTFTLGVNPDDKIIVVSLAGYETQEIKLEKKRDYSIVLKRSTHLTAQEIMKKGSPLLAINQINMN